MLITRAEIDGLKPLDVRIGEGKILELGQQLTPLGDEEVIDAQGGALLPGLHDHHLHLFGLAAALDSVACGPPNVRNRDALAKALCNATPRDGWIRGVGYHESVAGDLDRKSLDALRSDVPIRIQHRTGALWILNGAAIDRLALDEDGDHPGVERGLDRLATGRLFRCDDWLSEQLGTSTRPNLAATSRLLARFGVTGITDTSVHNSQEELAAFTLAVERGELRQRLRLMGSQDLPEPKHPRIQRGAVKILLHEGDLPSLSELEAEISEAHRRGRSAAIHCVTRSELVFASSAFATAGVIDGDRIEHASVAPPDVTALLAENSLAVVTQPNFIFERGDAYQTDVDPRDRPWLYRGRGFLKAGISLGAGTDAPYGRPDPWLAMRAAVERRSESGIEFGNEETLSPEQALALFTSPGEAPGTRPRSLEVGVPADLCLLDKPWSEARTCLSSEMVRATICDGEVIWSRSD